MWSESEISKHTKEIGLKPQPQGGLVKISVDFETKVARSDPDCDPGISFLILEKHEQVA